MQIAILFYLKVIIWALEEIWRKKLWLKPPNKGDGEDKDKITLKPEQAGIFLPPVTPIQFYSPHLVGLVVAG